MASSNVTESAAQVKNCRCSEGDANVWTIKVSDGSEKQLSFCLNCQVLKSGPLFTSSRGIGWTSWKKRWFILTRSSLVFFRSDPNSPPKGTEGNPNVSLGGIYLNNTGSVIMKADKKLLTVLFPDGRTITLKADVLEDLNEWRIALENTLAQAPNASHVVSEDGLFHNDISEPNGASVEQCQEKLPPKSLVIGRPILLALEEVDGSPSFLEKALRFIEQYGVKIEGILRQSADVEEVERRVQEYEQGRNEFSADEDAHVIGDCIKHVLRELPSSPVPATCCTALVEAYRTDHRSRIDAIRFTISDTFPEPNRRLVQRILRMMRIVASHKSENRMTLSAVAACMAPLLLRPLLAGDCEIENDFTMGGDGSIQLLQAAAAANHAQAIVIILLEHYEKIFNEDLSHEGSLSSEDYSDSVDDVEDEEPTDDDGLEEDGYSEAENDLENDIEDDFEHSSCELLSDSNGSSRQLHNEANENRNQDYKLLEADLLKDSPVIASNMTKVLSTKEDFDRVSFSTPSIATQQDDVQIHLNGYNDSEVPFGNESSDLIQDYLISATSLGKSVEQGAPIAKKPTVWGRTSARKNLSMESIDLSCEDENAIQRLATTKSDLQAKLIKEVKGNSVLKESLEKRKKELLDRRLALEREVDRLREQLQAERQLRASLESGLMNMRPGHLSITSNVDSKTKADLEEIAIAEADIINLKQKASDLRGQINHHLKSNNFCESCRQLLYRNHVALGKAESKFVEDAVLVRVDEQHKNELHEKPPSTSSRPPGCDSNSSIKEAASRSTTSSKKLSSKDESPTMKDQLRDEKNGSEGSQSSLWRLKSQDNWLSNQSNPIGPESLRSCNVPSDQPATDFYKAVSKRTTPKGDSIISDKNVGDPRILPQDVKKEDFNKIVPQQSRVNPPDFLSIGSSSDLNSITGGTQLNNSASITKEITASSSASISTSSALNKLATRLNFLKERRVQLVNELQSLETSRNHLGVQQGGDPPPP